MNVDEMVTKKSWEDFQKTGLFLIINQFLHVFGWSLVYVLEDDGSISDVYPARVKFRGFGEKSIERAYKNISLYMKEQADNLVEETKSSEDN